MQKGCNCRRNSRGSFPTGLKGEELHQGKEERETLSCARLSMKQARILSNQISEARAHQPIPAAHYLLLAETWSTTLMKQISIDAFDSAPCLLSRQYSSHNVAALRFLIFNSIIQFFKLIMITGYNYLLLTIQHLYIHFKIYTRNMEFIYLGTFKFYN